jgi:hypothetical protein
MIVPLRSRSTALASLMLLMLAACQEEDPGVTYADDIRPMFEDRCVFCHQPGGPFGPGPAGLDIVNPFAEEGLVNVPNHWATADHPELPAQTVVAGEPEASFLIHKISPPEQGYLPEDGSAGAFMPYQVTPMTAEAVVLVEQWVSDGAQNDSFFRCQVWYPMMPTRELATECGIRYRIGVPGKCDGCHFAGTHNPPDLADPFGPEGIVGVRAAYRADLLRVEPGSPERSLLVQKLRASAEGNLPSSQFGTPMPKPILPLDDEQVALVRKWILEGAKP